MSVKITIKNLEITPPIALAPMVGLSHSAFRTLVYELGGVGLFFSEMLHARRLPHDSVLHSPLLIRDSCEYPFFFQVVTARETEIVPALEKIHKIGAQGIDINLGCPAPVLKKEGAGVFLTEDHERLRKVLQVFRKSTTLPLSAKIRLGAKNEKSKFGDFCKLLQDEGLDLLTIHARFNDEKFCRKPRWHSVGEIRSQITIPLLINGGIFSVKEAKESLEQSGADGVMLGRGAVHDPWLCSEIARDIYGIPLSRKIMNHRDVYFHFIDLLIKRFSPEKRLGRLKQFTHYFASTFCYGHHLVSAIQSSNNLDQAKSRATCFFDCNGQ